MQHLLLIKNAYWKIGRLDIFCGSLSLIGLLLWWITRLGDIAIVFAIIADVLAAIPTFIKVYKEPETENYVLFFANAISAAITLLTIRVWDFATYGCSLYLLIVCTLMTVIIKFKLGRRNLFSKNYLH